MAPRARAVPTTSAKTWPASATSPKLFERRPTTSSTTKIVQTGPGRVCQKFEDRREGLRLVAPDKPSEQRGDVFRMEALNLAAVGGQFHICTTIHVIRHQPQSHRPGGRDTGEPKLPLGRRAV